MTYLSLGLKSYKTLLALAGAAGSMHMQRQNYASPPRSQQYHSQNTDSGVYELLALGSSTRTSQSYTKTQEEEECKMKLLSPLVGSEATTYSHFRFHPRHRKQRFSHNKFTCSKGTVTDHNCHTEQSTVANAAWYFSALVTKPNMVSWNTLLPKGVVADNSKRQIIPVGGLAGSSANLVTGETGNRNLTNTPLQVHSYYHQYKLQNRNKHPVYIDIWDIVAKESVSIAANADPLNVLQSYFPLNEGSAPYLYGTGGPLLGKPQMTYLHPDFKIGWCKEFVDLWTRKQHKRVRLQPGEEHIHTVTAKPNFIYDPYGLDNNAASVEWGGITQGTLFRQLGDMVHQESGSFYPTIDGTIVDYIDVWKVFLSQVDPWRDVFHLNIAADYPSKDGIRTTVGRIELENPTDTAGITS